MVSERSHKNASEPSNMLQNQFQHPVYQDSLSWSNSDTGNVCSCVFIWRKKILQDLKTTLKASWQHRAREGGNMLLKLDSESVSANSQLTGTTLGFWTSKIFPLSTSQELEMFRSKCKIFCYSLLQYLIWGCMDLLMHLSLKWNFCKTL